MTRRRWIGLLLGAAAVAALVWGYDQAGTRVWIGSADLEVEFAVTDASSGAPVPGAWVQVHSEFGRYEGDEVRDFQLVADDGGVARKLLGRNWCTGRTSGLRFTETVSVYVPTWLFTVGAQGYQQTELEDLHQLRYRRLVREVGPGRDELVVLVKLERKKP